MAGGVKQQEQSVYGEKSESDSERGKERGIDAQSRGGLG